MSKITIDITTKEWTEGDHIGLDLKISDGCKARIDWGDGKGEVTDPRYADDGWVHHGHYYKEKDATYSIVITSDHADSIIGFKGSRFFEVHTNSVDLSECPEIEELGYSGDPDMTRPIDLSRNTRLRSISVRGLGCATFDLSANNELTDVEIRECDEVTSLNLTKNDRLERLVVWYCKGLRRIGVSNLSALSEVLLEGTEIDKNSYDYLRRVAERNGGTFKAED